MVKITQIIAAIIIVVCVLSVNCSFPSDQASDQAIHSISRPHKFDIPEWELAMLRHQLWESLKPASQSDIDDTETVLAYFDLIGQGELPDSDQEEKVEQILSRQICSVLLEEGIAHPLDSWVPVPMAFPPVNFEFSAPPNLLIVSPRDEIKLLRRITLKPNLSTEEKEFIESQIDNLDYSALVVGLGGVGFTYPTMIYRTRNIHRAIEIATEEWFHQYISFKPLGFRYILDSIGWTPDDDIVTLNETTAGIVSKEIADRVYQKYYYKETDQQSIERESSEFETQMRDIRITADRYLAEGNIDQAEQYMNQMRDILTAKGYHIRKLNQAYFAFHGTYADDPATASPIGQDLQELRQRCGSLKEFLDEVSFMTEYNDLRKVLEEY